MIPKDHLPPRILAFTVCAAFLATGAIAGYGQDMDNDTPVTIGSTVPGNGDVNPYGVARVPRSIGNLVEGQFLISNFNNAANQQGTGTTIVQGSANGTAHLFAAIDARQKKRRLKECDLPIIEVDEDALPGLMG